MRCFFPGFESFSHHAQSSPIDLVAAQYAPQYAAPQPQYEYPQMYVQPQYAQPAPAYGQPAAPQYAPQPVSYAPQPVAYAQPAPQPAAQPVQYQYPALANGQQMYQQPQPAVQPPVLQAPPQIFQGQILASTNSSGNSSATAASIITNYFSARLAELQTKVGTYMGKLNVTTQNQVKEVVAAAKKAGDEEMNAASSFAKSVEGLYKADIATLDNAYSAIAASPGDKKKLHKFEHQLESGAGHVMTSFTVMLGALVPLVMALL